SGEWSQHDDFTISKIPSDILNRMVADCEAFQESERSHGSYTIDQDLSQAGHDFYLTRNGHGAGFEDGHWDVDVDGRWDNSESKRLAKLAKAYGEWTLHYE